MCEVVLCKYKLYHFSSSMLANPQLTSGTGPKSHQTLWGACLRRQVGGSEQIADERLNWMGTEKKKKDGERRHKKNRTR